MENKVNFQVEEALPAWLEDYPEDKFTVFNACFLSTAENSHHYDISEEVLRRDASTILGNFLIAKVKFGDAQSHEPDEIIYGYFPKEQEIRFEETNGIVKAWAYCVVSKLYSKEFNDIFDIQNLRDTSVEMTVKTSEENEHEVLELNIYGLTCLGMSVNGSCPDAMMNMVRFTEQEAEKYFNSKGEQHLTENFAGKTYKIDKSKEAMSDSDWSNVDKTSMRNKIMEAANRNSLVDAVYALVESGWEEAPSEHLKYPIMQLKGDTFVYNRNALSSALGYAKKEEEIAVVSKIEKIYKKLGINSEGKEDTSNMSEIDKEDDIQEKEENFSEQEEMAEKNEPEIEENKDEGESEEENKDNEENTEMSENEPAIMSCEEMSSKIAELKAAIEEKENIIMENEQKLSAQEAELSELREFKCGVEKEKMTKCVEATMEEVKEFVDAAKFAELREEGLTCKTDELDAWSNKVKATCFSNIQKKGIKKQTSTVWTFSAPNEDGNEPTDFWGKMNNKYN